MKFSLFPVALLTLLAANTMFGGSAVCPVVSGSASLGTLEGTDGTYASDAIADGGCNVLITFEANGSIVTTNPNPVGYYDSGGDDNMVGIVNDTGSAITSLFLTSTLDIFGFDGDGVCTGYTLTGGVPTATGANACHYTGNGTTNTSSYTGYLNEGETASGVAANFESGTINFLNGGIAKGGGSDWFSLEAPVSITLTVSTTPEPMSLVLLGTLLAGVGLTTRRQRAQ